MSTTEAEPQLAEPEAKRRWLRFRWWKLVVLTLLVVVVCGIGIRIKLRLLGLPLSWTADYDRRSYARVHGTIAADPQHLVDRPFAEVSRELGLENVPWDDIAMQRPTGMSRMYHFRGFRLYVTLELLPPGITPESRQQWNTAQEELDRHGVLWLAHDAPPFVLIDGIQTQKERIEKYRKAEDEICRQMNAAVDRRRREGGQ
jgi:hypothetical protein